MGRDRSGFSTSSADIASPLELRWPVFCHLLRLSLPALTLSLGEVKPALPYFGNVSCRENRRGRGVQ